jgi:glycosyltransferase involved in cell wall biosynthesis
MTGPKFTVFTPSHNSRYLDECLASLQAQTESDWEWVVMLNAGASWVLPGLDDRIRVYSSESAMGVGEAKYAACARADGEILVEFDHDDVLLPTALERIGEAFDAHPDASLVYSNWGQILEDGSRDDSRFNEGFGWQYEQIVVDDREINSVVSMEPTPHNVSYIWYAPNHVRAFRKSLYEAAGGYNQTLRVLDDQELISRLYRVGSFERIDECLYLQRIHSANTHRDQTTNDFIQSETVALYDANFEQNALAWADRLGLRRIDLSSDTPATGYEIGRFDSLASYEESSVGILRAFDYLGRESDKVALFNEFYRVLAPGGVLITATPSSDGRGAFQDPRNVAFYNENSFWYFTEDTFRLHVPGIEARFQSSRMVTAFPTEWNETHNVPYVYAYLLAIKDGTPRNGGPLLV